MIIHSHAHRASSTPARLPDPASLESRAQQHQDLAELSFAASHHSQDMARGGMVISLASAVTTLAGVVVSNAAPGVGIAMMVAGTCGTVGGAVIALAQNGRAGRQALEGLDHMTQASRLRMAAALTQQLEG